MNKNKKTVTTGVSLRRETLKLVDRAARKENRSRSSLIDVAARAYALGVLESSDEDVGPESAAAESLERRLWEAVERGESAKVALERLGEINGFTRLRDGEAIVEVTPGRG